MLFSRVTLSAGGPGFGDERSRSGKFGLSVGGTVSDRGGTSSVSGPVFPEVACNDVADTSISSNGTSGGVISVFGLDSGESGFDRGGMSTLSDEQFGVCSESVFPGLASNDGVFGCVVGTFGLGGGTDFDRSGMYSPL
jgi:hypothetical protein